jgi:2-phosphosulfolactate phosphatase
MSEESSGSKRKVEVCFSPALFPVYFQDKNCVVVVIDVFRATSAICSAIDSGVTGVIPVATIEEAYKYKEKGFLVGAERQAEVVEGFDFGNSPMVFKSGKFSGKDIVLTTTNGTKAVELAKEASHVVIGSFTNLDAVCEYLESLDKDVILFCAGWKDRFNLEDTLFAGAVVEKLAENLRFADLQDSAIASKDLYLRAKDNLFGFLSESSHRKRLSKLNLEEDIIYCLKLNQSKNVPVLKNGKIVKN